jgi:hypothetical protein
VDEPAARFALAEQCWTEAGGDPEAALLLAVEAVSRAVAGAELADTRTALTVAGAVRARRSVLEDAQATSPVG